jgi:uncharacterized repeat protein (TIGR01451 family)
MNPSRSTFKESLLLLILMISLLSPQGQATAETAQIINPAASAQEIAEAIARDPAWITGASFVTQPPTLNTANAVSDTHLTVFPTDGSTYGILTTGSSAAVENPGVFASTSLNGPSVRGNTDFDVTILKIDLQVPANNNCLTLNFQFFSEEFPQFVGRNFNDAFIAELDNSTWATSGSVISAPNNFAFDANGDVVSVNSSGVTQMAPANALGTAFDGGLTPGGAGDSNGAATTLLSASTPITAGSHSLYLSIFDQGDRILDSAVFLDDLVLGVVEQGACIPGAQEPPADLMITKSDSPDPVTAGSTLTYTLTVTNNGPTDATGVIVTDTLPMEVLFVSATASQGSCSEAAGVVACNLGNLASAASASVTIEGTVDPSTLAGMITNTASVTANENDPDSANNTANTETLVTVISPADLSITKTDSPDPVTAGGTLTYTLTINNDGSGDATDVIVTDTLPAGVTFDPATSSPGCTEAVPGVVTCDLGDLANGASATVTIVVMVDPAATCGSTLTNTAEVVSNESDPDPGDNSASIDTTITCPAELNIRPEAFPNRIWLDGPRLVHVAILSSPSFDAPNDVDRASLTFGHSGDEDSLHRQGRDCWRNDVNHDGLLDLVCNFVIRRTGFLPSDTIGILKGMLQDGTSFEAQDSVVIIE